MTANTKTLEAIRMLRDGTAGYHATREAIANALEESIQPPAEKRGEAHDFNGPIVNDSLWCKRCGVEWSPRNPEPPPGPCKPLATAPEGEVRVADAWNTKGPVYSDEQRKDPSEKAEASVESVASLGAERRTEARSDSDPKGARAGVAPRGLTPEEAEGARLITLPDNRELTHRVYEEARHQSGDLSSTTFYKLGHDEVLVRWVVELAHSEGSRAAREKGALLQKRIDVLRAAVRSLGMGSLTRESDARRYLSNDDDMARELGGEK